MKQFEAFLRWKQTRDGLIVTGSVELVAAYIFGSRAIDTGSFWDYLLTLIFFLGSVQSFIRAIKLNGKN